MERPIFNEDSNDLLDQVVYVLELEKYCNYLEAQNKQLILPVVTGSIGKSTKPILMDLVRTRENKDICVCDLCILKNECFYNTPKFRKCLEENTDDQYYL